MLFNSYAFLCVYLPVTLAGFAIFSNLSKQPGTTSVLWLGACSLAFYGAWKIEYVPLLVGSIAFNFLMGRLIAVARHRGGSANLVLGLAIAANLTLLGYYKYLAFLVGAAADLFGLPWRPNAEELPLGISFYTFTQIAFLVDVARGHARDSSFSRYLLFVTFFPHLIAGPILHHARIIPQFLDRLKLTAENTAAGASIFVIGLAKKLLIADEIAVYATRTFEAAANGRTLGFFDAWGGAIAYALQLYFDFSGYSDMAIGLALIFGIRFPVNFASPYKSENIIEFWRRWHMTLSAFLRDYLYVPLGGNRQGKLRRHLNLIVTMLLGGLWHGAGWNFLLWGGLHGLLLSATHLVRNTKRATAEKSRFIARGFKIAGTFAIVVLCWVPFRAPDIASTLSMWRGMFGANGFLLPTEWQAKLPLAELWTAVGFRFAEISGWFFGTAQIRDIAIVLALTFLCPNTQQIFSRIALDAVAAEPQGPSWLRWRPSLRWSLVLGSLAAIATLKLDKVSEFLYYQF